MLYDFMCTKCGNIQTFTFLAINYNKNVAEDGRIRRRKCKECKSLNLYRYLDPERIPIMLGGSKNYMSMERYWAQHPGEARRREDEIAKKIANRHNERVTSRIDKQKERRGRDNRHKGYGEGQREQKLNLDD